MGCSEEHRKGSTLGNSHDGSSLDSGSIHHSSRVVHSQFEIRQLAQSVGKPGAAFVKQDNPRPASQMVQPTRCFRPIPIVFDIRNKAGDDH